MPPLLSFPSPTQRGGAETVRLPFGGSDRIEATALQLRALAGFDDGAGDRTPPGPPAGLLRGASVDLPRRTGWDPALLPGAADPPTTFGLVGSCPPAAAAAAADDGGSAAPAAAPAAAGCVVVEPVWTPDLDAEAREAAVRRPGLVIDWGQSRAAPAPEVSSSSSSSSSAPLPPPLAPPPPPPRGPGAARAGGPSAVFSPTLHLDPPGWWAAAERDDDGAGGGGGDALLPPRLARAPRALNLASSALLDRSAPGARARLTGTRAMPPPASGLSQAATIGVAVGTSVGVALLCCGCVLGLAWWWRRTGDFARVA